MLLLRLARDFYLLNEAHADATICNYDKRFAYFRYSLAQCR